MENAPNISKNFNAKLFSEINRKILYKNLFSIILFGFFKGFISLVDFFFGWSKNNLK